MELTPLQPKWLITLAKPSSDIPLRFHTKGNTGSPVDQCQHQSWRLVYEVAVSQSGHFEIRKSSAFPISTARETPTKLRINISSTPPRPPRKSELDERFDEASTTSAEALLQPQARSFDGALQHRLRARSREVGAERSNTTARWRFRGEGGGAVPRCSTSTRGSNPNSN